MKIELPRGAFEGRSRNVNPQILQNLFAEIDQEGGKTALALYGTPGLSAWSTVSAGSVVRSAYVFGTALYIVCGAKLYSVSTTGTATELGSLDTSTGHCDMFDDGTYLILCDGTSGYTYNPSTTTFAKITDGDFIGATSMASVDGYTFTSYGDQIQSSTLIDPTEYSAIDYTTERGKAGDIVSLAAVKRWLWVLKEKSGQAYYNTAGNNFPFSAVPGAAIDHGCAAFGTVREKLGSMYWLSDKRWIVRTGADSYQVEKISPVQLDYQLSQIGTISDAVAHMYDEAGHVFYQLTFPTDEKTYVLDVTTGLPHTRTSYDSNDGADTRHWANCYAYFNGNHIVGHYSDGKLYTQSMSTYKDGTSRIRRIATFPNIHDPKYETGLRINRFGVEFKSGVGLTGGVQGEDPKAMFQYSKDSGNTWSSERWGNIGKIGEYGRLCEIRRCGISKKVHGFIPRVIITDPVEIVMVSAYADIERMRA